MKHCCEAMQTQIDYSCEQHSSPFECPDQLIYYSDKFNEYGIVIHDGGASFSSIMYCPWCGFQLPVSKRDQWFDELEMLGFDDPWNQEIPLKYQSDEWYRS